MNIKKLSDKAIIPTKGSDGAAGYDLYSVEEYELKVGERKAFKTDISMAIPKIVYGRVAPRSGLAVKKGIDVMAGVIDSDYRGEILVALINLGQESVKINVGDKIAQIIFELYTAQDFTLVDDLDATDRGFGGFGSTDTPRTSSVVQIPDVVKKSLEDLYRVKHENDIVVEQKYSEKMKEIKI